MIKHKVNWSEIRLWVAMACMLLGYVVREAHKVMPEARKDLKTAHSVLNDGVKFYLCGCTVCAKPL